ncbi:MAG: IS4 family transposase, partial [Roseovarius sp.]|uniref:IS4 family transposase n=1 Tax=Roseovarius sp. TaxID=1486281 RepID=UPI0032EDDD93
IEELRHATADRLSNCIALCCVMAWRVTWLAMLSRETPAADPAAVFTEDERNLLDQAAPDRKRQAPRDLEFYVRAVARLGGYLDRASDAPPGTTVIWRGFSRLADLVEGARLATPPPNTCG